MEEKRTLPPTYFILSGLIMVILQWVAPIVTLLSFPWSLLGLVPLILGVLLNLTADATFKRLSTTVRPFEQSAVLVTEGVFRLTRNPMYLGMTLILLGVALLLGSLTPILVAAIFAVLMDRIFIAVEERMLAEIFGEAWADYAKTVRRWI